MEITATLIGEMITFAILVWFINRFLWVPMTQMMADRKKRVADGLAAAERGKHEQELAEKRAKETIHNAKEQANEIINHAQQRANEIVEEAKGEARGEAERILASARSEIEQETTRAKEQLRAQVSQLAVEAAEKVLEREVNEKDHSDMLNKLVAEI